VGGGVERIVPATAVNLGCVEGNEENCDRFFLVEKQTSRTVL